MIFGQLYNLITMDNISSSCCSNTPSSYGPFVDILGFSIMQKLFTNFGSYIRSNYDHKLSSTKLSVDRHSGCSIQEDLCHLNKEDDRLSREDVKMVIGMLGMSCSPESEQLQEWFDSNDLSDLFEEKEPSFEEIKQAFDVFDENGDGFIDAQELQRILQTLGFLEVAELGNCQKMIKNHDSNGDGNLDFKEFVKFMEKCFS